MASKRFASTLAALALTGTFSVSAYAFPAHAAMNTAAQKTVGAQQQPYLVHHTHDKGKFGRLQQVAAIIGVDVHTLKESLKNGQSIVDVAQSKGNKISEQELIAKLKTNLKDRLDKKVAKGKLTKQQADQILTNADQRLKTFVEDRALFQHKMKHKHHQSEPNKKSGSTSQTEQSNISKR